MSEHTSDDGRFAYDGLDPVMHAKARVGILTALVTHPHGLSFTDLARLCRLTDGNLSKHLETLAREDGDKPPLVTITKSIQDRRPLTTVVLTGAGRKRFREYLSQLERVLRDAADAEVAPADTRTGLAGA